MNQPRIVTLWVSRGPEFQALLRIVTGFLFIWPGSMKLFAFPIGMPGGATLTVGSQLWIGAWMEVVGGALMMAGLFTRPVAFLLAGEMAVAYWQFHAPRGFWPIVNGGTDAAILCFVFLYFSAAGAGPWSLDARRSARGA